MHAPVKCLQNAPAYFSTSVSYERKMFMKSTPAQPSFPSRSSSQAPWRGRSRRRERKACPESKSE
jgi:hypothetical protein